MKKILLIPCILLVALSLPVAGQVGGVTETIALNSSSANAVINVPADAIFEIIFYTKVNANGGWCTLTKNGISGIVAWPRSNVTTDVSGSVGTEIVGPATITVIGGADPAFLTYNMRSSAQAGTIQTPSNAVVIPANASGSVNVKLESSVDLVTWTDAIPGSYNPSTEKRFFRVRAVIE